MPSRRAGQNGCEQSFKLEIALCFPHVGTTLVFQLLSRVVFRSRGLLSELAPLQRPVFASDPA